MLIPLFSSHCWATWLGMRGSGHTRLHGENRWRRRGFFRPKAGSKAVAMDCADRVLSKVKYKKLTRKSPLAWDGTSHMVWLESPEAVVSEALPMACEEWVRWHEKELVLTKARAQKEKDARLRLKHLDALWFMMVPCPCSLSTFSAFAFVESRGYPRPRWNVWGSRFLSLLFIVYCNCMLLLFYVYIYIHTRMYIMLYHHYGILYTGELFTRPSRRGSRRWTSRGNTSPRWCQMPRPTSRSWSFRIQMTWTFRGGWRIGPW